MKKIVGIRFKPSGKVYDFDSGAFVLRRGDCVIVETEQGLGFGVVVSAPSPRAQLPAGRTLKKVYRIATEKDHQQRERNIETEKQAYRYCQDCIQELGLKMNLFSVESNFDASKLTFYFTSEGRVDFRQLVKMLVKDLGARVEMRQVGIRNQAKICGGIGRCGRRICCSAFIEKFEPVSIRMAKDQSLSLNPTKISGLCGRLMCCLTFENDTYQELKEDFPRIGTTVTTIRGRGKIVRQNVLTGRVVVRLEDGTEIEEPLDEIMQTN
ncbi:MAG: stage 0 sporulation family protein [Deltaproteobacteria bacterium]|nr:stage 0 sporulation family protein [Deltaproteobacteria bacterium]MBW2151139.1 stage 0 sporulation family protein [Deltaproteobacteria bacterium]